MSRKAAGVALIVSLAGLILSVVASYTHYRLLRDPSYVSFCDVSATVSCTSAYLSRFGSFYGVPVALLGAIWFALATLLSIAGLVARPEVRESASGYLFAGSTASLAVVLYLAYASFVVLKTVCPVCLVTYAAVLGLFFVSGAATTYPMTSLPRRVARDLRVLFASPLAVVLAVLFVGASASTLAFFPREATLEAGVLPEVTQGQRSELERFMATEPRVPLVVPTLGAKVLIVKFNDYQCPACGQSYLQYKPILAKYEASNPGAVRLVTKDFPLSSNCNASVSTNMHGGSCDAAVAVRLARQHNRGEELAEWYYTHQSEMTPEKVREMARTIGQVTDFDAKYASTLEQVKADINMGRQLGINQTPTFFINGVKIGGAMAPQYFDEAIAYELRRATAGQ